MRQAIGAGKINLIQTVLLCVFLGGCLEVHNRLEPSGAGFSVTFPGRFLCGSWKLAELDGVAKIGRYCGGDAFLSPHLRLRVPTLHIGAYWGEISEGVEAKEVLKVLQRTRRSSETNFVEHSLTTQKITVLGGLKAVEVEVRRRLRAPYQEFELIFRSRYLIKDKRLYRLSVAGVMTPMGERIWQRFVDSFRLDG